MKNIILMVVLSLTTYAVNGQTLPPSKINFKNYFELSKEAYEHRKDRVIHLTEWLRMSKEDNTIILDTRSKAMYDAKHIKGAIHLNFSDFNVESLKQLIPDSKTRILIYCNNNIDRDDKYFVTKGYRPVRPKPYRTLSLNVPTFINLYGYGYNNVYELADLVDANSGLLQFEGTAVDAK